MNRTNDAIHEKAFIKLSKDWLDAYGQLGTTKSPSRQTDLDALSAMLIAVEHSGRLSIKCFQAAKACSDLAQKRMLPWIDVFPWYIACDHMVSKLNLGEEHSMDYGVVSDHLDESRSALRIWAMEIAWLVREKLPADEE